MPVKRVSPPTPKFMRAGLTLIFILLLFFSMPFALAAVREYLPGDFVHVIVDAPSDTAQITAVMPDATTISLVQERVSGIWRGIWQVPINFNKGTYTAKLTAIDIGGNIFEGRSDPFTISELTMVSLVGKPTVEAAKPASLREKITVEAPAPGVAEQEIIKVIRKLIAQPVPGPLPGLKPSEKEALIERNLNLGKENLARGRFSESATYFRIVLYLSPDNKVAGSYLVEAQGKIERERAQRWRFFFFVVVGVGVAFLFLYLLFILLKAKPVLVARAQEEKPGPESGGAENEKNWCQTFGWQKHPFASDILKQLFVADTRLEYEGLVHFIRGRIEAAGGQGLGPFTEAAMEKVFSLSKGKPSEALKICAWAVNQAIKLDKKEISAELIKGYESIQPKLILVADDEEIVRSSLSAILQKGGGYRTDSAVDGEEALQKIKQNVYACVLLDIEMPRINGYEILKQVRAIYPELPVIFVTGKGKPDKTMESVAHYNLTGYIEKPFTAEKVLDVVARTIKN